MGKTLWELAEAQGWKCPDCGTQLHEFGDEMDPLTPCRATPGGTTVYCHPCAQRRYWGNDE